MSSSGGRLKGSNKPDLVGVLNYREGEKKKIFVGTFWLASSFFILFSYVEKLFLTAVILSLWKAPARFHINHTIDSFLTEPASGMLTERE
jgi:hypothetical protein